MAGMQRFVTYIYAYENGQKTSNAGYAKIETRGNAGRLEIHFSDERRFGGEAEVSFLYPENEKLQVISVGTLLIENGRAMGQYTFHTEMKLDTKVFFDEIVGLRIKDENQQEYRSFWKDVEVPVEMEKERQSLECEMPGAISAMKAQLEQIKDAEQQSLHTMEIPVRNVFPSYTMEDIWQNFTKNRGCVQINNEVCAVQIELSDLRELPKQYWYLGNNSFLLHGFFNYHHLLFGKLLDGKWFIGIPGVYERQERVMASVFGFPGFLPIAGAPREDGAQPVQKSPAEMQQGVWYHILED